MNPLDQLRDMHAPAPPGWWPPAPGWWLAGAALLLLVAMGLTLWYRYRKSYSYKKKAIKLLYEEIASTENPLPVALQLVRRTIKTSAPQSPLLAASGSDLIKHIDTVTQGRLGACLSQTTADTIDACLYGSGGQLNPEQRRNLVDTIALWLKKHRREDLC